MRLMHVIGTRPNFVKMAPVIAAFRAADPGGEHSIVHTGQHYDRMMSGIFLDELGVREPDHMLGVGLGQPRRADRRRDRARSAEVARRARGRS